MTKTSSTTTPAPSGTIAPSATTSKSPCEDAHMPSVPRNMTDRLGRLFDDGLKHLYPERLEARQNVARKEIGKLAEKSTALKGTPDELKAIQHSMDQELQAAVMQKLSAFFIERPAKRLETETRFSFRLELERGDIAELQADIEKSLSKTKGQRAKALTNSPDINTKTVVAFDLADEMSNQQLARILAKVSDGFKDGVVKDSINEAIKALNVNDSDISKVQKIDATVKSNADFTGSLQLSKIDKVVNDLVASAIQNRCEGQLIVQNAKLQGIRTEVCSFSSIELNNVISSHCNWSGLNLEPQGLKLTNYVSYLDKFYGNAPEAVMDMVTFYGFNHDHLSYAAGTKKLSCLKDNINPATVCFTYERYLTDPKRTNEFRQTSPWQGKSFLSPAGLVRYVWPSRVKSALTSLELVNAEKSEPGKLYRGLQDLAIAAKDDAPSRRELRRFLVNSLFNRKNLPPEVGEVLGSDIIAVKVKYQDGTYQSFSAIDKDMSFLSSVDSTGLKLTAETDVTHLKVELTPMFNAVDESKATLSLPSDNDFIKGSREFYVKPDGMVELLKIMAEFEKRFKKIVLDDVALGKEKAAESKKSLFEAHDWLESQIAGKPELFRRDESGAVVKQAETKAPASAA